MMKLLTHLAPLYALASVTGENAVDSESVIPGTTEPSVLTPASEDLESSAPAFESNSDGNSTTEDSEDESPLTKYSFAFLKAIYSDGLTLALAESGMSREDRHMRNKVVRLGNLELNYDSLIEKFVKSQNGKSALSAEELKAFAEKQLSGESNSVQEASDASLVDDFASQKSSFISKAGMMLQKKLGSGLLLYKSAPEDAQIHSFDKRNQTAKAMLEAMLESGRAAKAEEKDEESSETSTESSNLTEITTIHSGSYSLSWENMTIGDVWSFDGWHLAASLAEDYADTYKLKEGPGLSYSSEFVPEGSHILGAAAQVRRQKSYAKLAEEMKKLQMGGAESSLPDAKTVKRNGKISADVRKLIGLEEVNLKTGKVVNLDGEKYTKESVIIYVSSIISIVILGLLVRKSMKPKASKPSLKSLERAKKESDLGGLLAQENKRQAGWMGSKKYGEEAEARRQRKVGGATLLETEA